MRVRATLNAGRLADGASPLPDTPEKCYRSRGFLVIGSNVWLCFWSQNFVDMQFVDLTKLRPGDIIFTTAFHYKSFGICAIMFGRFSHALVVVYPDVWWETDGRGAGYRVLEKPRAFSGRSGKPAFVVPFRYAAFRIIRLHMPPTANSLLASTGPNICLEVARRPAG